MGSEKTTWTEGGPPGTTVDALREPGRASQATTHRVLVVEDDCDNGVYLNARLAAAGYQVSWAKNVKQALMLLEQERPDVVLLDLILPDGTGTQVCDFLARSAELTSVPVVVLTAQSDRRTFDELAACQVAGFFIKPFGIDDVFRHLERLLKRPG